MKANLLRWVVAGVILLCLGVPVVSAASWTTETVDNTADVGRFTSLALDVSGLPNISYLDTTNSDLRFAYKRGGSWFIGAVDTGDVTGGSTSLALDNGGFPHISYPRGAGTVLQYAAYGPPSWTIMEVNSNILGSGEYSSLTFTPNGNVMISNYGGQTLETITGLGTVWSSPFTVDNTADVGRYSSINYSTRKDPYWEAAISYYDVTNGDLKYAIHYTSPDPGWAKETVDSVGNVGLYTSLEFDSFGDPHISYYDATNGNLKYATKSGATWTIESVDTAGDVGLYTSLDLDPDRNPHISYYDATNGMLKYATKAGGSWYLDTVDSAGDVGRYSSLALDTSVYPSKPFISYYDVTNSALKFASVAAAPPGFPCGEVILDVAPVSLAANGQQDLDRGDPGLPTGAPDILWSPAGSGMVPENDATIVYLGMVDFSTLSFEKLARLSYDTTPIGEGNIKAGAVFAGHTNLGNYTKVQVISRDGANTLQLHQVIYASPEPCQDDGYDVLINSPEFGGSLPAGSAMYGSNAPLPADSRVDQWGAEDSRMYTSPHKETWLYVYDPTPKANWEHLVYYYFVSLEDNSIDGPHTAYTPPLGISLRWLDGEDPLAPLGRPLAIKSAPGMNLLSLGGSFLSGATLLSASVAGSTPDCTQVSCGNCYAVLISGGVDRDHNYDWYYEDIADMYQTLTDTYCYPPENIYVLISDGTSEEQDQTLSVNPLQYTNSVPNLDGEGGDDVEGGASLQMVTGTLSNLRDNVLTPEDTLFIFTTNHGGIDPDTGKARLWLWDGEEIGVEDFVGLLHSTDPGKTPQAIYLLMQQCSSGGFVGPFIAGTPANQARIIATATMAGQPSYENDFSSRWIEGVTAPGPANFEDNGGDANHLVSMTEAFNYAFSMDDSRIAGLETPQYGGGVPDAGPTLGLSSCSRCPDARVLQDGTTMPGDPDGNGLYEDVNGDSSLNSGDAVAFFQNMAWIANPANEPACAFDFNGNRRIDFGDIVTLYQRYP